MQISPNQRQRSPNALVSIQVPSLSVSVWLTCPQALWFSLWVQESGLDRRGSGLEVG